MRRRLPKTCAMTRAEAEHHLAWCNYMGNVPEPQVSRLVRAGFLERCPWKDGRGPHVTNRGMRFLARQITERTHRNIMKRWDEEVARMKAKSLGGA